MHVSSIPCFIRLFLSQQCVDPRTRIITAMTSFPVFAFLLSALAASANGRVLSDLITMCKANDPNLNTCVKDAANSLIPKITEGFPEYNIPVLDPLFTSLLDLIEDTKYVTIDLKYIDITQTGLSKMVMNDAKMDLGAGKWVFDLMQPIFSIVGKYKSKGTVMDMAVNGEGDFNSTHFDTKILATIHVNRVKKGDAEYFKVDKFELDYTFGTAKMHYTGLFNGDLEMEKSTNDFLNEHSHEILTDLKPALEQVYSELFRGYLDSLLDNVPVTMFFPEN